MSQNIVFISFSICFSLSQASLCCLSFPSDLKFFLDHPTFPCPNWLLHDNSFLSNILSNNSFRYVDWNCIQINLLQLHLQKHSYLKIKRSFCSFTYFTDMHTLSADIHRHFCFERLPASNGSLIHSHGFPNVPKIS